MKLRACAAAVFLLQSVVGWIKSDDMTYHYSKIALWGVAELTCGILVFAVPTTPKAFRGMEPSTWFRGLQPWLAPGRKQTKPTSRPRSIVGSPKSREYEQIDDQSIPLPVITSPRPTDQQYGIICTTDIVITETYEYTHTHPDRSTRYPWTNSTGEEEHKL